MELKAAIEGLRTLKERCEVEIVTDSEYLKNGITQWIAGWKKRNWMTSQKKPVLNRDLWEELDDQVAGTKTNGPGPKATRRTKTTTARTNWLRSPRANNGVRAEKVKLAL